MKNPLLYIFLVLGIAVGYFLGTKKKDEELVSKIQTFGDFTQTSASAYLTLFKEIDKSELDEFLGGLSEAMEKLETNVSTENVKAAFLASDTLSLLEDQKNEELKNRQYRALIDFYLLHHDFQKYEEALKIPIQELIEKLESDPDFKRRINNANQAAHTTPAKRSALGLRVWL